MKGCKCIGCKFVNSTHFFWDTNYVPRTDKEMIADIKDNLFLFLVFSFGGLTVSFFSLPLGLGCWSMAIIFYMSVLFDKKLYLEKHF